MDDATTNGVQVIRAIEAYVTKLSGMKTEVTDCNFRFTHDKDDDVIGLNLTVSMAFLEENENG